MKSLMLSVIWCLLLLCSGAAYAQDSDLKKVVDAIRNARTEAMVDTWERAVTVKTIKASESPKPTPQYLVLFDQVAISDEALNKHSLEEITQVALSFDPNKMAFYGTVGLNGVILITSKKSKPGKL